MSRSLLTEQTQLITLEQEKWLKQLEQFQTVIQFHSLTEIPLGIGQSTNQNSEVKQKNKNDNIKEKGQQSSLKQLKSIKKKSSILFMDNGFSHSSKNNPQNQNQRNNPYNSLHLLNKQLDTVGPKQYYILKQKLLKYKQQSDRTYRVGQFLKSYQQNFKHLVEQKEHLVKTLKQIKGQTSSLVQKQKRLIDLSMAMKQSLDYYTYLQKNELDYPCEVGCRQMFQDNLQSILSTIMDGIEFFKQNKAYVGNKKYLNQYLMSKSKILSFVKSFFIKLFNKQSNYLVKHVQANKLFSQLNSFYPKSRLNFLTNYLLTFPHCLKQLKNISLLIKDQRNSIVSQKQKNLQKTESFTFLQLREHQINQFMLSDSNISLIKYLQKNNYEIYNEIMLNLWTFNRFNFHQNLVFVWAKQMSIEKYNANNTNINDKNQKNITKTRLDSIKSKIYFVIQIIISQYIYFNLNCRPSTAQSIQFVTNWLYKLIYKYLQVLIKEIRDFVVKFKYNPFQICEAIENIIDEELNGYFQNLGKQEYESYVIGCLWLKAFGEKRSYSTGGQKDKIQNQHVKLLHSIFHNILKTKVISQLSQSCFQHLPKIQPSHNKTSIQQSLNTLIYYIPKLHLCSTHAQNYMISSLDTLIKSIKQINLSIQSRFQCYTWNLLIFGSIRKILKSKKFQIVSKQIRLDFNQSLNIIDRVKRLQRSQSLIKYAQDIFNVLKNGMPSLNQLTLDFNKYINQHYQELQERFLKDILFIYAKNMIEFLQKVMEIKKHIQSEKHIGRENKHQEKEIKSQKQPTSNEQSTLTHLTDNDKSHQSKQPPHNERQKSPKSSHHTNSSKSPRSRSKQQISKICDPFSVKSLYNLYILSIEKYITQSKQILRVLQQSKIKQKQEEIKNIRVLIKQVYQKLFDFFDTFYITLSEFNSDLTAEFQEIEKIKENQEKLWFRNKEDQKKEEGEQSDKE